MNKVEFSADTGAPRIIIQANPTWEAWVEICEAVGHGTGRRVQLLDGCHRYDEDRAWVPYQHCGRRVDDELRRGIPDWISRTATIASATSRSRCGTAGRSRLLMEGETHNGEVTEGMSFRWSRWASTICRPRSSCDHEPPHL